MGRITDITIIKEFTNHEITYGVYSVIFNDKQEIFIRNNNSIGIIAFLLGESASKCVHEIREDVKQEFFECLKNKKAFNQEFLDYLKSR